MKLPSSGNPTAASSLSSIPSPIGTGNSSQNVSANPSLDIRPLKKFKMETQIQAREPETCLENSQCFWNHICVDGVRRGADGPDGDNWGDMRPDSGDIQQLLDGDETAAPARFKGRDEDLEKGDMGLERRDLVAEAREFELDDGGEDLDEEDLDSELIEQGKAAYWEDH
ncbi:uncharacterized protein N7477_007937 [Penicillium maclennaniae]|uniref:uncharacterized protein n=1 Tax=Penicillium maclennaniae TaxID=1343394 RepID=UPI0025408DD4|nr:uncharacterized protein N7477_007937 [Penicillium maclennaniae]KAJ5665489.1 hypothetical protein N7477_007937 [Penicillium maclennaniae]